MSIIYDALKKVSKSQGLTPDVKKDSVPKAKYTTYIIYTLIVCLGFFMSSIFFGFITKKSRTNSILISTIQPSAEVKQNIPSLTLSPVEEKDLAKTQISSDIKKKGALAFTLNGVFYSQDEGYALINNQILKEGDTLEGWTIKRITSEEVELESGGELIKLSTKS